MSRAELTIEQVIARARQLHAELTESATVLRGVLIELAAAKQDDERDLEPVAEHLKMLAPRLETVGRAGPALGEDTATVASIRNRRVRFSEVGLARAVDKIGARATADPGSALRFALHEISRAAEARQPVAVARLVDAAATHLGGWPWPGDDVVRWAAGDGTAGRRAVDALLAVATRAGASDRAALERLHIVAAVLARDDEDLAAADEYLATALEEWRPTPRLHVERAALLVSTGERRRATDHARRALELDPSCSGGELVLGVLAEAASDYDEASELYASACGRLTLDELSHLERVAALLRPTGLLQLVRAKALAAESAWGPAQIAAESAIALGVGGPAEYPDIAARQILYDARASEAPSDELSRLAMELGMRYVWTGALEQAVKLLTVACQAGPAEPAAGWNLAAALWNLQGDNYQERAVEIWEDWYRRVGPPTSEFAWAYPLRGAIAEDGTTNSVWRSVVYCEKALVLNPVSAHAWGDLSISLYQLNLLHLAWSANDSGFAANPDHEAVLGQRVALLGMAGRYEDALAALDRVQHQDPRWIAATRTFLLNHLGRADEALAILDGAGGLPPQDMFGAYGRAVSLVDVGRYDAATSELERTIALDLSSRDEALDVGRQAEASLILGQTDEARRYVSELADREAYAEADRLLLSAIADFVDGRGEDMLETLDRVIPSMRSRHEAMDALALLRRCAAMAVARGQPIDDADALIARVAALADARVEVAPEEAEVDELDGRMRRHVDDPPDEPARIALDAVRARRLTTRGQLNDAAAIYRALRETWFEPEATSALERTLNRRLDDAIEAGDADVVRESAEELRSVGRLQYAFVDVAVADALHRAGEIDEATRLLVGLRPQAETPDAIFEVERRIGELLMVERHYADAASAFSNALNTRDNDPTGRAQLHVRLALSLAMTLDLKGAVAHSDAAISTWRAAGDVQPLRTLALEVNGLVNGLDLGGLAGLALEMLQSRGTKGRVDALETATTENGTDDVEG
jgi:tetratricopeptide (TPR) repeat protein